MKVTKWFNGLPTFPRELLRALFFTAMLSAALFFVIGLSLVKAAYVMDWSSAAILSVAVAAIIAGVCVVFSVRWKRGWK